MKRTWKCWLAGLGLVGACGDPSLDGRLLLLDLNLGGMNPQRVEATITIGEQEVPDPVVFGPQATRASLLLPSGTQGKVSVSLAAQLDDECLGAFGDAEATLNPSETVDHLALTLQKRTFRLCTGTGQPVSGVAGLSDRDFWIVGVGGTAQRWDGKRFTTVPTNKDRELLGVWAAGPNQAWMAGVGGLVLRWEKNGFVEIPSGTDQTLWKIQGSGTGEVWAVGTKGTVLRYSGGAFTAVPLGIAGTPDLYGMVMLKGQPLVLGQGGLILRWNNDTKTFVPVSSGTTEALAGAVVTPKDEVWLSGTNGTVLRGDGTTFRKVDTGGVTAPLYTVWTSSGGTIRVGGDKGALLSCNPASEAPCSNAALGDSWYVRGLFGISDNDFWVVGSWRSGTHAEDALLHRVP